MNSARLFVVSAPSGSGKTTILNALLSRQRRKVRSVSMTTRPPRAGEKNGRDYRFVTRAQFERARSQKGFLEYARILGHWYGTPRRPVEQALKAGRDVLLGVDIQGARQIRKSKMPVTTIFLLPPSFAALRQRLKRRGTETPDQIQARLRLARRELAELKRYDYAVVNDRLDEAIETVRAILKAEKCRVNHVSHNRNR